MKAPDSFLRRLKAFDPDLDLRWSDRRQAWSVERWSVRSDTTLGPDPDARALYYWCRGKLVGARVAATLEGTIRVLEEWRYAPEHVFWWDKPLGFALLQTLAQYDGHRFAPREAFQELVQKPADAAQAERKRDSLRDLPEIRKDIVHAIRKANGAVTTIAT